MSAFVKGFGCRPLTEGAASTGGRRRKTSKGGNRGKGYVGDAACAMGICLPRMVSWIADEAMRHVGLWRCGS